MAKKKREIFNVVYSTNPDAIKKREQRANKKSHNETKYKEDNTKTSDEYRKKLRNKKKDDNNVILGDVNTNNTDDFDDVNISSENAIKVAHDELDRVFKELSKNTSITTEIVIQKEIIQNIVRNTRIKIIENDSIHSMSEKMFQVSKNESNDKNKAKLNTFIDYFARLRTIRKHYYKYKNLPIPTDVTNGLNIKFLHDVDGVMDCILNHAQFKDQRTMKYYSLTSIESWLNGISGVCRRLQDYEEEHKQYGEELKKIHAINEKRTKQNRLNEREIVNYMEWSKILSFPKIWIDINQLIEYYIL